MIKHFNSFFMGQLKETLNYSFIKERKWIKRDMNCIFTKNWRKRLRIKPFLCFNVLDKKDVL